MKNKLIYIFIILSSFLFIGNAKALSESSKTNYVLDIYNQDYINLINTLDLENFDNLFDDIYNDYKDSYPYYLVTNVCYYITSTDSYYCNFKIFFFQTIQNDIIYQLVWDGNNGGRIWTTVTHTGSEYLYKMNSDNIRLNQNEEFILTKNDVGISENNSYYKNSDFVSSSLISTDLSNIPYKSNKIAVIYDTNLDIALGSSWSFRTELLIDGMYYEIDDTVPTLKSYIQEHNTPNVQLKSESSIINENNEILQTKITASWGIKDYSKYKYAWKNIYDDNWKYFFENSITDEILVNKNGTYIFQVTDLEDNYISSSSITITNMLEQLPTLNIENYTSEGCYYNNQKICDIITIYSENADFSKYTLQYKIGSNWITHNYENSAKGQITIYENTTVKARIIRNSDNSLIDSASYTVATIDDNILFDKPTFNFEKTFCTNMTPNEFHEVGQGNFKQTLKMTIYGLDTSVYKVYYSTDNANTFTEITEFESDRIELIKYYSFEYYTDTTIVIKITDLEGNYVTGTAYTLHFTCNDLDIDNYEINNVEGVFKYITEFFNKFKQIMLKIKELIEYFYSLMNDEIKAFILTIFIVIIITNLIMRMMK